jgi:Fe-S-cluster containining protein
MTRTCGSCGLCCKLIGVGELNKPMNSMCAHWDKDKGCTIYDHRPNECLHFTCLWLSGLIEGKYKPLKTGIVCQFCNNGIFLHEDRHTDAQIEFRDRIEQWRRNGIDVGIVKYDSQAV